jgi:glyoxylase-like metal-dependent hydrolase (beta-lactamase superfamily II)
MLNWKVGKVKITSVVETVIPFPAGSLFSKATPEALKARPWLFPHFVKESDTLVACVQALLVEAPGLRLLVDTCIGNDKPRRMTGGNPLAIPFLQHLGNVGWNPDTVNAVLCTHLHVDHVGWNTMWVDGNWIPTFPKARYLWRHHSPSLPNGAPRMDDCL